MPRLALESVGTSTHEDRPRDRMAAFLARQYRRTHKFQALASEIAVSDKVAENLFNGHWPNDLVFAALVKRFGQTFLDEIVGDELEQGLAALAARRNRLLEELEQTQSRIRQIQGTPEGVAAAWAEAERHIGAA